MKTSRQTDRQTSRQIWRTLCDSIDSRLDAETYRTVVINLRYGVFLTSGVSEHSLHVNSQLHTYAGLPRCISLPCGEHGLTAFDIHLQRETMAGSHYEIVWILFEGLSRGGFPSSFSRTTSLWTTTMDNSQNKSIMSLLVLLWLLLLLFWRDDDFC